VRVYVVCVPLSLSLVSMQCVAACGNVCMLACVCWCWCIFVVWVLYTCRCVHVFAERLLLNVVHGVS